jgi:hypothetical protein
MGFFYAMKNTGQILRSKKNGKSRYTPISNDILQSETLTPEEKSILVHLLSLPENWVVYKGQIWRNMNIGRDRFSKHWNGLVEKGYIISIRMIDKDTNLIKGWNHVVYEEPVLAENRIDGDSDLLNFSNTEAQLVYKEDIEQSNNLTKETLTKGFDVIWEMYGKVGNRKTSIDRYKKLTDKEKTAIEEHIPKYIKNHVDNDKVAFIPHFTTYLNQRRWEDDLPYKLKEIHLPSKKYNIATLDD